jgi:hypothetical protein
MELNLGFLLNPIYLKGDIVVGINVLIVLIIKKLKNMEENKVSSLEKFLDIIEKKYPEIKKLIAGKTDKYVYMDLHFEEGKTFVQNSEKISPILHDPSSFGVKKHSISYNEKYGFYNITLELY